MAAVALLAEIAAVDVGEGMARDDGDAVIALLPVERDVPVAELVERGGREIRVRAFRLLQAQHVGLLLLQEAGDGLDAQADRVDVPGDDGEAASSGIPGEARLIDHAAPAPPSAARALAHRLQASSRDERRPPRLRGLRRAPRNRRARDLAAEGEVETLGVEPDGLARRAARPCPASLASAASPSAATRASRSGSAACSAAGSPGVSRSAGVSASARPKPPLKCTRLDVEPAQREVGEVDVELRLRVAPHVALAPVRALAPAHHAVERDARVVERIAAPALAGQQQRGARHRRRGCGCGGRVPTSGTAARRPNRWRRRPASSAARRRRASPARRCAPCAKAACRRAARRSARNRVVHAASLRDKIQANR